MKRLSAVLLFLSLFTLTAWTLEDCVEVNFDHPDCDRYTTTTTEQTTTTQPEVTTSTGQVTTTTVTQPEVTTTVPSTTTTIQECAEGLVHQPPLCVPTTIPFFDTTTVPDTTSVISPPAELPFTGTTDLGLLALAGVSLLFLGLVALRYGRRAE